MSACARVSLLLLLFALHVPGNVRAQDLCTAIKASQGAVQPDVGELQQYGDIFEGSVGPQHWRKSAWASPYAQTPDISSTDGLYAGLLRVQQRVEAAQVFVTPQGKHLHERLLAELGVLLSAVKKQLNSGKRLDWIQFEQDGGKLVGFEARDRTNVKCQDAKTYATNTLFFSVGDHPVVLAAVQGGGDALEGLSAGQPVYYASVPEAVEFRAAIDATAALFRKPLTQALGDATKVLGEIDKGWTNYLQRGFSQYPWEAWINTWGDLSWTAAPRTQYVFVHPEAAIILDLRSQRDAVLSGSLLVHGFGVIGYGGSTRNWFLGASATGAITTSSSLGLGAGPTLHLGHAAIHSRVPHISLALLWFSTNKGDKHFPFIGISADIWRMFSDDNSASIFRNKLVR